MTTIASSNNNINKENEHFDSNVVDTNNNNSENFTKDKILLNRPLSSSRVTSDHNGNSGSNNHNVATSGAGVPTKRQRHDDRESRHLRSRRSRSRSPDGASRSHPHHNHRRNNDDHYHHHDRYHDDDRDRCSRNHYDDDDRHNRHNSHYGRDDNYYHDDRHNSRPPPREYYRTNNHDDGYHHSRADRSHYDDARSSRDEHQRNNRDHRSSNHQNPGKNDGNSGRGGRNKSVVQETPSHLPVQHTYKVNANVAPDEKIDSMKIDDPRGNDPTKRITKKAKGRGTGRNTESFDPASTLVRPDLRILVGSPQATTFTKKLKHDDVVIVPELFGDETDWTMYYKLIEEMKALQESPETQKGSEWISWHEGAHLISKNPKGSPTFEKIIDKLCQYFNIRKESIGTRFNWYKDSTDWKPFHHDSAAFNPQRAKNQNITVGVSFGATRELAFIRATPLQDCDGSGSDKKLRLYFPQTNNGVFSFGRDANILWKHGVNALSPEDQDGKGRISIILWGLAQDVVEEEGSPPILGSNGQGPHAAKNHRNHHRQRNQHRGNNNNHNNKNNGGGGRRR